MFKLSRSRDPYGRHAYRVLVYYQVCSTDDPGLTLTYFTARSNLVPYAFVWEKLKQRIFSETIVVYDIKVGRCSQLNEYMKLMSTKGQGHSLTSVQISQIQYFYFISSITTRPIEAEFHAETPWDGRTKACSNSPGHMTKVAAMPIYSKNH